MVALKTASFALFLMTLSLTPGTAAPIQIVALGGSDTQGVGASSGQAYPTNLEKLLRAKGYDVTIKNSGLASRTAAMALAELDSLVPSGTTLVIVEMGINDAKAGVEPSVITARLTAIAQRLKQRGMKVLLCGHPAGFIKGYDPNAVFQANKDAAAATGSLVTSNMFQSLGRGHPELISGDGMHANAAGYQAIANDLLPVVMQALGPAR